VDCRPELRITNVCAGWTGWMALIILLASVAGHATAAIVNLAWDPVASPLLAGYAIHYGPASGNYTTKLEIGNATGYQVQDLAEGNTYYFAVTAYDATHAESEFSNEVSATVPSGAPVAGISVSTRSGIAPLALNFTSTSAGTITAYRWSLGDGATSTAQNPSHVYTVAGVYTVSLTVTGPGGSDTETLSNYVTVTNAPPPDSGSLIGARTRSTQPVDVTIVGTDDWALWPGYVRSADGGSQISDITMVGSGQSSAYSGDRRSMTWSNGYPTASGLTDDGVSVSGIGNGFRLTAPADATTRTLTVFVGVRGGNGTFRAHLSDGSATDYDATFSARNWRNDAYFTLTYRAASPGQGISVEWTQTGDSNGSVTLQGAALSGVQALP
jgi:PKD repeat protein